jgi:hypothetical protein
MREDKAQKCRFKDSPGGCRRKACPFDHSYSPEHQENRKPLTIKIPTNIVARAMSEGTAEATRRTDQEGTITPPSAKSSQDQRSKPPKIPRDITWKEAKLMMTQKMDPQFQNDPEILSLLEEFKDVFDLDAFCSKVSTKIKPIVIQTKKPKTRTPQSSTQRRENL